MMLSGLMEITIKTKKDDNTRDEVKVVTEGPKYDVLVLEQDVHGLTRTLEIKPAQDFEHLDPKLQQNVRHAINAVELCKQYDSRAMESGTVSDHSQLPLVYKIDQ